MCCPAFSSLLTYFHVSYSLRHPTSGLWSYSPNTRISILLLISGPFMALALFTRRAFHPLIDFSDLARWIYTYFLTSVRNYSPCHFCNCYCFCTPWTSRACPVLLNTSFSTAGTVLELLRLGKDSTKINDELRTTILSFCEIQPQKIYTVKWPLMLQAKVGKLTVTLSQYSFPHWLCPVFPLPETFHVVS